MTRRLGNGLSSSRLALVSGRTDRDPEIGGDRPATDIDKEMFRLEHVATDLDGRRRYEARVTVDHGAIRHALQPARETQRELPNASLRAMTAAKSTAIGRPSRQSAARRAR